MSSEQRQTAYRSVYLPQETLENPRYSLARHSEKPESPSLIRYATVVECNEFHFWFLRFSFDFVDHS